jgi:hypothetical protein
VIDISEKEGKVTGMMVTTKGYEAGAKTIADYFRISLSVVKNISEFVVKYRNAFGVGAADALASTDACTYKLGIVEG